MSLLLWFLRTIIGIKIYRFCSNEFHTPLFLFKLHRNINNYPIEPLKNQIRIYKDINIIIIMVINFFRYELFLCWQISNFHFIKKDCCGIVAEVWNSSRLIPIRKSDLIWKLDGKANLLWVAILKIYFLFWKVPEEQIWTRFYNFGKTRHTRQNSSGILRYYGFIQKTYYDKIQRLCCKRRTQGLCSFSCYQPGHALGLPILLYGSGQKRVPSSDWLLG